MQERQRALIRLLSQYAEAPVDELRVIEVGCGAGGNLLELITLGFNPENLMGNELLPARVALARRNLPAACVVAAGDALDLQLRDESCDIVYQSTVFSSLLDPAFQGAGHAHVALGQARRRRALVRLHRRQPANPDVRGVPLARGARAVSHRRAARSTRHAGAADSAPRCRVHPSLYPVLNAFPRCARMCWVGSRSQDDDQRPTNFLPFALPEIGEEEIAEVVDTLRSGWVTTGPKRKALRGATSARSSAATCTASRSTPPPRACTWRWRRSASARATR